MNYSGGGAPVAELRASFAAALRARGVELVGDGELEEFLARHRIRWTGGIGSADAAALRSELAADGALFASVDVWQPGIAPKVWLTLRLVSAGPLPRVLFIDARGRSGDDAPGLFALGWVSDVREIQRQSVVGLAASLARFLASGAPRASACASAPRFEPHATFRSPLLDKQKEWTVAVLPFVNETARRNAGEAIALAFLRQILASPRLRALEPGIVREQLFQFRITPERGVTLDQARVLLELLDADLVLVGSVRELEEGLGERGVPRIQFSAMVLDRENNEIAWDSSSQNAGDDGVIFFDAGFVSTSGDLGCRMIRAVVDGWLDPGRNTARNTLR